MNKTLINWFSTYFKWTLVIAFANENRYEIRVDNDRIYTTNEFYLSNGEHVIEIWNACLEMIRDTIYVGENNFNVFRFTVGVSQDYLDYKKKLKNYHLHKFDHIIIPTILTVGTAYATIVYYKRGREQYNDLLNLKSIYQETSSPSVLADYPTNFGVLQTQYYETRLLYYGFMGATALATTWSFFGIKSYIQKFTRPTNTFYKSPFTEKDYALNLNIMPGYASLTLNF